MLRRPWGSISTCWNNQAWCINHTIVLAGYLPLNDFLHISIVTWVKSLTTKCKLVLIQIWPGLLWDIWSKNSDQWLMVSWADFWPTMSISTWVSIICWKTILTITIRPNILSNLSKAKKSSMFSPKKWWESDVYIIALLIKLTQWCPVCMAKFRSTTLMVSSVLSVPWESITKKISEFWKGLSSSMDKGGKVKGATSLVILNVSVKDSGCIWLFTGHPERFSEGSQALWHRYHLHL